MAIIGAQDSFVWLGICAAVAVAMISFSSMVLLLLFYSG
jgi:hypothetical protein